MAKSTETIEKLEAISTQVDKIGTETGTLVTEVQTLKDELAGRDDVPDDVVQKIDALAARIQAVDDLVPDAEAPTPTPEAG